ncbi:MAG: nucleotidyltransferase substrate binding protein [Pseudobdellovibrionaceae bacterium]
MTALTNRNLTGLYYGKIVKSLKYLEYSYNRTLKMPVKPVEMTDSELEAWDSFASRFARTSDIFLSKYIKAYLLTDDPAYEGGFHDQLNRAEKLGLLANVETWMDIRELRNATVHEYSDQDLEKIFEKFRKYTPLLLALAKKLKYETES